MSAKHQIGISRLVAWAAVLNTFCEFTDVVAQENYNQRHHSLYTLEPILKINIPLVCYIK